MLRSTFRHLARGLTRRPSPARKAPRTRRWQPALEELENRLVPAVSVGIQAGVLIAQCDSALTGNTVTVDHVVVAGKGFAEINGHFFADTSYNAINIIGGAGGTVTDVHADVKPLTVLGDSAKDVVNVGDATNKLQGIQGSVLVEDEKGFSSLLNINDQGDAALHTQVTLSTVPRAGDTSLGQLTGLGAAAIQWDYHDTAAVNLRLGTGASTVDVLGTGTTTNIFNSAAAIINVSNGSVAGVQGSLNLENETGKDAIIVNDQNDSGAPQTVTLSTIARPGDSSLGAISGLPGQGKITYDYADTSAVNLNLGREASTVDVLGTGTTTNVINFGNATINVGSAGSVAGIRGTLNLENVAGAFDTVNINSQNDTASQTVTLSTIQQGLTSRGAVNGLPSAQITWDNARTRAVNLNLGSGSGTVDVLATGTTTNVVNHGNASINVGNNGSTAGIHRELNLENTLGKDDITINSQNDSTGSQTVFLLTLLEGSTAPGVVSGLADGQISYDYAHTSAVTLNLGREFSTVDVQDTGVTTDINNNGNATINVGAGSTAGIKGALNLENVLSDTVFVHSQLDGGTQTVTLSTIQQGLTSLGAVSGLPGGARITWDNAHTSAVNLNLGSGASTVDVLATGTTTNVVNNGNADIFVGNNGFLSGIQSTLNLESNSGSSTIFLDDSLDDVFQSIIFDDVPGGKFGKTLGVFTSSAMTGGITWDNGATSGVNLFGGQGGDFYNVFATGSATTINGGFGANTFNVGGGILGGSIVGPLTLHGGGNANTTLNLDDSLDPNSETFNFGFTGPGTGHMTLGSTASFDLAFDNMFNGVNLLTNGFSTVNAPPGNVNVF
jgi:hypothetical protein